VQHLLRATGATGRRSSKGSMRQWIGRAQTPLNATNPILEPNKK